jgi:hypothetical protein
MSDAEETRLSDARTNKVPWKRWGPYLSERQWGTVREDYSQTGNAWSYFTHDQARSRAYRWGEDGLAGISDDHQFLCFALALWNGRDPILKERLFGLTNDEGNHGDQSRGALRSDRASGRCTCRAPAPRRTGVAVTGRGIRLENGGRVVERHHQAVPREVRWHDGERRFPRSSIETFSRCEVPPADRSA